MKIPKWLVMVSDVHHDSVKLNSRRCGKYQGLRLCRMRLGSKERSVSASRYGRQIHTFFTVPNVALEDTHMLTLFFENLEREQPNVRVYVQDALSSMIDIYTDLPKDAPAYEAVQKVILDAVQKVKEAFFQKR